MKPPEHQQPTPSEDTPAAASEVLHVSVAPEALEPPVLVFSAHLLDQDPLDLVANLVQGLNAGIFAVFSIKEEATFWKDHRLRALALLDRE